MKQAPPIPCIIQESRALGRTQMARSSFSSSFPLILLLTLTLEAFYSASQQVQEFQSINWGGEAFKDPNTNLNWEADPFNKDNNELLYGNASKVNPSFKNITYEMTTLRYFSSNTKFCYSLEVSNGSTYLLRASFLYGNYDGLNKPPTFILIFNYDQWTNISTSFSTTPIMHELTFVSKAHSLSICLAPHINSSHKPFISTLEMRRLGAPMYRFSDSSSGLDKGYGLMLWKRINYGAIAKDPIRYPDDIIYDRIWEANTSGPSIISTKAMSSSTVGDPEAPPAKVMATAITTKAGNLSFTYNGFGGVDGFRVEMHFQDPDENTAISPRTLSLAFPNSQLILPNGTTVGIPSDAPVPLVPFDQTVELPEPLQITLFPVDGSPRGPLLNAIELFRWTPQPLSTSGTFPPDGLGYLHRGCDPTIIHRDVKSSNILLSDKMQAKVSNFGLSRFKEGDATMSHVSTVNVVGTVGYIDPAYNSTNQLTDKSDVYSFGVVLFELICGRAPINMLTSPPHIVEWATTTIMQGKVGDIVDPMLGNGYKVESMWKVIDVAFGCVESDRMKRPKMNQVSQLLQTALEIETDQSPPASQDVRGSSSTFDGKQPTLQYLPSLQLKLQPGF